MKNRINWPEIVFFDGECMLCNRAVDFLLRHDRHRRLKYASLQSVAGSEWFPEDMLRKTGPETIIFLQNGRFYSESEAVFRIVRLLGFPWNFFLVGKLLPLTVTDRLYRIVARNRYSWFGKTDYCRMPDAATRDRILS